MRRSANGRKLAPQDGEATRSPAEHKLVRVGRPANDNLPRWATRTGTAVVVVFGGIALAVLVIAVLLYA